MKEKIKELETFRDFEDVVLGLMETKKENIQLEAELHELMQVTKNNASIKSVLEEKYRFELDKREQERKSLVKSIIDGVVADLKDPKMVTFL